MPDYIYKITDLNGVDKAEIRDKALTDLETAGNAGKVVTVSGANTLSATSTLADLELTGTPTAPTAAVTDDSTKIATTAFVKDALDTVVFKSASSSLSDGYRVFAKIKKNTGNASQLPVELLIGGTSGVADTNHGLWHIFITNKSNTFSYKITQLDSYVGTNEFGYYSATEDGTDYWYVGVHNSRDYAISPSILVLRPRFVAGQTYPVEIGDFYSSATMPTGWTAMTIYQSFVPTSRTINNQALSSDVTLTASNVGAAPEGLVVARNTSDIDSLNALQTQLDTWFSSQPERSTVYYYFSPTGSWSPFYNGWGVIIQITKASSGGIATFFGRSDTSVPMIATMICNSNHFTGDFFVYPSMQLSITGVSSVVYGEGIAPESSPVNPTRNGQIIWLYGNAIT